MSRDIWVNVQRVDTTTPAISNVHMQLDNLPLTAEVLAYEGVTHVEHFQSYVYGIYDIRQTDIVIDATNIDPVTTTNYRYRVISLPEPFPDGHMEATLSLLRGGV